MNHRERILAAIRHQPVDRIPTDLWATVEVEERLLDYTHYLIERLSDFFADYHCRCFEALRGRVDVTQVTDDFGWQKGLLIRPQVFDEFYRGAVQRRDDLAKAFGVIVFHHDDGDMRALLPRLVNMGIGVLNPIQWRGGDWDLEMLKAEYGPCHNLQAVTPLENILALYDAARAYVPA